MIILFETFYEDLDAYAFRLGIPKWTAIFMIVVYPATWAIGIYRFGYWIRYNCNIPIIKQIFFIVYYFLKRISEIITGIEISPDAKIGKGLFIGHLSCIVIGETSKIGKYSSVHQGVTIGGAGRGKFHGFPTIGDCVYFGAGAKVLGKINIGNNVMIGANAVVVKSIPDNSVVGGVPAKVLSNKGSMDYIQYRRN